MKFFGYHTGPLTHLDHLGVLCAELEIPLITSDSQAFDLAKLYFPNLSVYLLENQEALSFLAEHCDVLLGCGKYWASQLKDELFLFYGKSIRVVYCPHGNSDKGRTLQSHDPHPSQDIVLFYGNQMHDLWKQSGQLNFAFSWLFSGNYRYRHYLKRKTHYDSLAAPLFEKFSSDRKTIFYAPTWPDKENPTPVLQACAPLIEHLKEDFQLLIKLHPLLIEQLPSQAHQLLEKYKDTPFVQITSDFFPIYPILAKSDLYLGDFSSIGYDALAFDLPLYFLVDDLKSLDSSDLAKAGPCFQLNSIPELYERFRDSDKFKEARKALYQHAFGGEKKPKQLLEELICCIKQ